MALKSFPLWERGLKLLSIHAIEKPNESFPLWERGLKHVKGHADYAEKGSFPLWERGLKRLRHPRNICKPCRRSPCGNVD